MSTTLELEVPVAAAAHKAGMAMGLTSVLLWSLTATLAFWAGGHTSVWQYLVMATAPAGVLQVILYSRVLKAPPRRLLLPPPRVLLLVLIGFVLYHAFLFRGVELARFDDQKIGVSLMNYLWPSLTILASMLLVRGTPRRPAVFVAIMLSVLGLLLANLPGLLHAGSPSAAKGGDLVEPYTVTAVAAVLWAVYSALTSRWVASVRDYPVPPLGFLLTALMAAGVCTARGLWTVPDAATWTAAAINALGPCAAGYMLWELALLRASPGALGLLASVTPILSILWLTGLLALTSSQPVTLQQYVCWISGAVAVGLAVVIGNRGMRAAAAT